MEISASMVKDLRERTGAGMMDCKKALVESNGDMDKAIDYLREKGISKAAKKAERIAAEGLANIYVNNNDGLTFSLSNDRILKRIDGLLFYNSEVKKIIAGKEERRIIDTRTFFLINHFMYELYKVSKNNKQLIVDTLDSSSIEKIINNVDTSAYNKFTKVGYKLILKRKYKQLFKWYNIAKLVIKVKGGK